MSSMKERQELDIELPEGVAEGVYSNLVIISHSTSEFVLDFAALMPGVPKAKVRSRVILAPEHAKRLLMTLQDNVAKYETNLGEIHIHTIPQDNMMDLGFNVGEA